MRWPEGVSGAGGSCGIKTGGGLDLGAIVTEQGCAWAGAFTHNAAAAAPVLWSRSQLGNDVRAVVVNSGNANACTGPDGGAAVERTAGRTAALLGCRPEHVLVASTGVIGVRLPIELIEASLPSLLEDVTSEVDPFARSIMTTDTVTKTARVEVEGASIVGVAKGAAMLAPNMATMLAFIVSDADIDAVGLQQALGHSVERSFNRISIDACESTNDSVFALSTRQGPRPALESFTAALTETCRDLAHQMVGDAEGGSRVVRVQVEGAKDEQHAVELGRAVAASALWRAAIHGADPNWGRIASALGQYDRSLRLSELQITIGSETLFEDGRPVGTPEIAKKAMDAPEYTVACRVGSGRGAAEILTSDLSTRYVIENAWGTT